MLFGEQGQAIAIQHGSKADIHQMRPFITQPKAKPPTAAAIRIEFEGLDTAASLLRIKPVGPTELHADSRGDYTSGRGC